MTDTLDHATANRTESAFAPATAPTPGTATEPFIASPRQFLVGAVDGPHVEAVVQRLRAAGVDDVQLHVLDGRDGIHVLQGRTPWERIVRRVELWSNGGEHLADFVQRVERVGRDHAVVAVSDVPERDMARLRRAMTSAGADETHYFGRWRYD